MAIRTRKPKIEAAPPEDEDFADTLQSEGDIVSQLPARYRSGKISRVHIFGPLVLFLAVVAGGYIGYDYFSHKTPAGTPVEESVTESVESAAIVPSTEITQPSEVLPTEEVSALPLTVEVRNGTATAGLAKKVADLLAQGKAYTVQKVGNASTRTFPKTLVVVLGKDVKSTTASSLADQLQAELVLELPTGEAASAADILIVVGQDQVTAGE